MVLQCRLCRAPLERTFVDLGAAPPCESYLTADDLERAEVHYPLHVRVCEACLLVQLPEVVAAREVFGGEYAYFSSYSDSWVAHAERFVERMVDERGLSASSLVVEVASNDGYLLQHLVARGIPVLGVEPAANVAAAARRRGVRTEIAFLGRATAERLVQQHGRADLVVANNVLAHVPDLVDFVAGLRLLLADDGLLTVEVPHLLRLVQEVQYDTIYHEHYSYFSLLTASRALATADLQVVDVEELASHGGSLRISARPGSGHTASPRVAEVLEHERAAGLHDLSGHEGFSAQVHAAGQVFLELLVGLRRDGCTVAGYGAPGKGSTMLNFCGVRPALLPFTVDRNPYKQGRFLPGSRIPVRPVEALAAERPDVVLVLPWNLREEIGAQLSYVREWGGRLAVAVPQVSVW